MKTIIIIITFLVILFGTGVGGYYYGLSQEKDCSPQNQISQNNDSDTNNISNEIIDAASLVYKDFTYNQLTTKYPASWIKSEIGDISTVAPKELINKYNLSIPLLATTVDNGQPIQYTISIYEFSLEKTIDEIIKELVQDTSVNGAKGSITAQNNISNTESIYETQYEINNTFLKTKEKLLLVEADGKKYGVIASMQSPKQYFSKYQSIADYLLGVTLIQGN